MWHKRCPNCSPKAQLTLPRPPLLVSQKLLDTDMAIGIATNDCGRWLHERHELDTHTHKDKRARYRVVTKHTLFCVLLNCIGEACANSSENGTKPGLFSVSHSHGGQPRQEFMISRSLGGDLSDYPTGPFTNWVSNSMWWLKHCDIILDMSCSWVAVVWLLVFFI